MKGDDDMMSFPLLTETAVWLGVNNYSLSQASYVFAPWAKLASVSQPAIYKSFDQYWTARASMMVAWLTDGATLEVVDVAKFSDFAADGKFSYPHIVNGRVFAVSFKGVDYSQATVVIPETGHTEILVDTTWPDTVMDANSDGTTLAWVVTPGPDEPGWLWTSPFADTQADIVATKRRPTPPTQYHNSQAGNGYYAIFSHQDYPLTTPGDGKIHVYRLSDAREWTVDIPGGSSWFRDFLHIDESYLWYQSYAGIVRVRLDALGAGTPAP